MRPKPKPTVQILSNSKCEVERWREVGSGAKKEKKKKERLSKDIITVWIPLATSFLTLVFLEVGVPESFFGRYHFHTGQVSASHGA